MPPREPSGVRQAVSRVFVARDEPDSAGSEERRLGAVGEIDRLDVNAGLVAIACIVVAVYPSRVNSRAAACSMRRRVSALRRRFGRSRAVFA